MNQDGDPIGGEVTDDRYAATFLLDPAAINSFPFVETFAESNLDGLTGWALTPDALGRWSLTCSTDDLPCSDRRLSVRQNGAGSSRQSATLALDATAWPAEGNVYLDLWAELAGSHSAAHRATLLVSGDGENWSYASSLAAPFDRPAHFTFDLRQLLSSAGIAADQLVFVQWAHFGATGGDTMHLGAVNLASVPAFGPRVVSHTPVEHQGGTSRFVLSFDSPIDPATFLPGDVTIYLGDPDIGDDIDFAATAIEPLDDHELKLVGEASPEKTFLDQEASRSIEEVAKQLKPREREFLRMYYYDELPKQEIARALGIKEERLRLIKSRALQKFREIYRKWQTQTDTE
jgi:RNA polymerase sigma factor (sigma-70 family)